MTKFMRMAMLAGMSAALAAPAYAGEAPGYQEREQREYQERRQEREAVPPPPPAATYESRAEVREAPGMNNIQVAGAFFHALGSDRETYSLDFSYGVLPVEMFEIGIRQGGNISRIDHQRDEWLLSSTVYGLFHLRFDDDQMFVPFGGGFLGAAYNDQDAAFTVGPTAGLRLYMSPSTYVAGAYRYEWFADEIQTAEETTDANHVVTVGIGYRF